MSGALLIIPSQAHGYPRFEASPTFGLHNFLCRLDYDISYICAKISSTKSWSDKEEDCSNFRVGILHMFQQHFHSFSSILPLQQFRLIALKSPQIRQTPLNLQNPLSPLPLQPKPFTFTQILNHPDTSKISFHFGSALLNFNLQTAIIFNF